MTTEQFTPLDVNAILTRLQDCFNYLVLVKAATTDKEEQVAIGYYQRGIIEAKRLIKTGGLE